MYSKVVKKHELAKSLGYSPRTFRKILNGALLEDLQKRDYKKDNKFLTPKQANFVLRTLGEPEDKYQIIMKHDLAKIMDISQRTLSYWLNEKYFKEMKELGYNRKQKFITPLQFKYLDEKTCIF
ncbi:hypothetical protein ACUNWD_03845 [Sunxiuqinia sp. A32]|uniref:hypothetical protein n=1 Tax=Sunxiuqinia sp. A32 TaxID=3461496 RepID=UPI0040451B77